MHQFFYLFAVRELVLGLALTVLEAYGKWRAVTVLLGCIGINCASDFFFAGSSGQGWWPSFTAHGIFTVVAHWSIQ